MSSLSAPGDKSGSIVDTGVAFIVLTTIAIILRFSSRVLAKKAGVWWDDYLALAAWIFLLPLISLSLDTTAAGMGKHIGHVSLVNIDRIELDIYVGEILYNVGLTCTKLSALLFYVRIFTTHQLWFRLSVWAVGFLCVGWCVAITFLGSFQCNPPQAAFNLSTKGNCLSQHNVYVGTAVPNVIIDFLILILPLPIIKSLHADVKNRIALGFIFVLGYCVMAVSIARVVIIINLSEAELKDLTWNFVTTLVLVMLEPSIGLISICLPAHAYLVRYTAKYILALPFISSLSSLSLRGRGGAHTGTLGEPIDSDYRNRSDYAEIALAPISTKAGSYSTKKDSFSENV